MASWLQQQFDKILLAILLILGALWSLHIIHHADTEIVNQVMGIETTLLGALITIITGSRLVARKADGGGNGAAAPSGEEKRS